MELAFAMPGGAASKQTLAVSDKIFGQRFNPSLVHQIVTAYQAGARAGTKAQKNRSAVSGGGRKPWRQKGTGRARAGTIRSPIWRGGGVTFAAKPRDHKQKVNRKMHRAAMRSIFSELIRKECFVLVDDFVLDSHKTRDLVAKLKEFTLDNALLLVDSVTRELCLAARNIPHITVCDVTAINPVSLLSHDKVLVTQAALKQIEEKLA